MENRICHLEARGKDEFAICVNRRAAIAACRTILDSIKDYSECFLIGFLREIVRLFRPTDAKQEDKEKLERGLRYSLWTLGALLAAGVVCEMAMLLR